MIPAANEYQKSNSNSYLQRGAVRTPRRSTTRGPPPSVEGIWVLVVVLLVVELPERLLLRLLLGLATLLEAPRCTLS